MSEERNISMSEYANDPLRDEEYERALEAAFGRGIYSEFNACMFRDECRKHAAEITALRAALDQERAKVERLREFAHMAAKIAVEMDDDDFGLSVELERAGLIDEEGNPTALLSGRGEVNS